MQRKKYVAVFGSNDLADAAKVGSLCEDLGHAIVGLGCRIVCGGLGGVMEAVCRGAQSSEEYETGDTIGLLPSDQSADANPYVDVVIPTGLGLMRNMLVAQTGDACIGVRGGSGTLSEMAFAWQLGKPIAVMCNSGGWSEELAGRCMDERRQGYRVMPLSDVEDALRWLRKTLALTYAKSNRLPNR